MRLSDLKYLAAYLIPGFAMLGFWYGQWCTYLTVGFAFVLVPALEPFLLKSERNFEKPQREKRRNTKFFDVLLYLNVPLVYGSLFLFGIKLNQGQWEVYELVGNILGLGIVLGTSGINVAHELGHRKGLLNQLSASMLLLPTFYLHFTEEHNRGHHKHVSTPLDPASAHKGQSLYSFWAKSVIGTYQNAWRLERNRMLKSGMKSIMANRMLHFQVVQVLYIVLLYILVGTQFWTFLLAGILGFLLLETINYIEHYGLRRKLMDSGYYERTNPSHSWNSNFYFGRIILYELTRHSDHHYLASKKYQILDHHDQSPQLPVGYPASMLLSLIPPLWFRVMDRHIPESMLELP